MTNHSFLDNSVLPGVIGALVISGIVFCLFPPTFLNNADIARRQLHPGVSEQQQGTIPTIEDIQRRVGAVPDGKLGPETQAKWERALCDQFAVESFRKAMPQSRPREGSQ